MKFFAREFSDLADRAVFVSWLAAKQRLRYLVMARGRNTPGCILYRLGRHPFLLRRILSFEPSEPDLHRHLCEQYSWMWGGGGEEETTALGTVRMVSQV